MLHIHTLFDHSVYPPIPLMFGFFDSKTQQSKIIRLRDRFKTEPRRTIQDAFDKVDLLRNILLKSPRLQINNLKSHIKALDINPIDLNPDHIFTYDGQSDIGNDLQSSKKRIISELIKSKANSEILWQNVLAKSHIAYAILEDNGIYDGVRRKQPIYFTNTYSGRSRNLGFGIQNATQSTWLAPCDHSNDLFVHFDWVAADLRVVSILSKDEKLQDSFIESDPYTIMANYHKLERKDCKDILLKSINTQNIKSEALAFYPKVRTWVIESIDKLNNNHSLKSILGRQFTPDEKTGRTNRSVFNAIMQGSVAHATQHSIYRISKIYPSNLFAEIHDSIVVVANKNTLEQIINRVSEIMLHPFAGLIKSNPKFPLKVSIGQNWKAWEEDREIR